MRTTIGLAVLAALALLSQGTAAREPAWRPATSAELGVTPSAPGPATAPSAGRWVFLDPVTGAISDGPAASRANALTADLLRDGLPGPDLRLQVTPEGYVALDTAGLRHFQRARREPTGRLSQSCRAEADTAGALAGLERP